MENFQNFVPFTCAKRSLIASNIHLQHLYVCIIRTEYNTCQQPPRSTRIRSKSLLATFYWFFCQRFFSCMPNTFTFQDSNFSLRILLTIPWEWFIGHSYVCEWLLHFPYLLSIEWMKSQMNGIHSTIYIPLGIVEELMHKVTNESMKTLR